MKSYQQWVWAGFAGWALSAATVFGQNLTPSNTTLLPRNAAGRILQPEPVDSLGPVATPGVAARPERPERTLPPEIREQLRRFRAAQESYLKEQERLQKLEKGATDQDRQAIRQRLQELHQRWQEQSRKFRDETTQRMRELRRNLPKHREALDETRPGLRARQPAGLD
ncbi:MAG TPA: hypothetical protein VNO52_09815 [Methylomirabilota bacterium]|nr:hypothetical protein [Methylomirabilota bacterium]